mgnify:CR=1 FL=1
MDTSKNRNGWTTFLQHWGMALTSLLSLILSSVFLSLGQLQGTSRSLVFLTTIVVGLFSIGVLVCVKRAVSHHDGGNKAPAASWQQLVLRIATAFAISAALVLICLTIGRR